MGDIFLLLDGIMEKLINPWSVHSIYDFSYFCCPECDGKWQYKQDFVDHAFKTHPKSIDSLQHEIRDGSLNDIHIPDVNEQENNDDTIKTEEAEADSESLSGQHMFEQEKSECNQDEENKNELFLAEDTQKYQNR